MLTALVRSFKMVNRFGKNAPQPFFQLPKNRRTMHMRASWLVWFSSFLGLPKGLCLWPPLYPCFLSLLPFSSFSKVEVRRNHYLVVLQNCSLMTWINAVENCGIALKVFFFSLFFFLNQWRTQSFSRWEVETQSECPPRVSSCAQFYLL